MMHDSTTGLRERKKAETRKAISDVALALAVERGPGDVTVDDIAAGAGVSARTVFNYFGTKEAAILGIDPTRRRELFDRLAARPAAEDALHALQAALHRADDDGGAVAWRTRARLARDHPQLQSAYLASFASLEDGLTATLALRLDTDPATDPYPRLVVAAALTAMRVGIDNAIDRRRTTSAELTAAIEAAFATLANGLQRIP